MRPSVAALASQTAGSLQMAPYLARRSLLIVHGTRDKVLPASNARNIFDAARQRSSCTCSTTAGYGLTLAREELLELLQSIPEQLGQQRR